MITQYTAPLGLQNRLSKPNIARILPATLAMDMVLILVCATLLGGRFVAAPGYGVSLPAASTAAAFSATPTHATVALQPGGWALHQGRVYNLETLGQYWQNQQKNQKQTAKTEGAQPSKTLLVYASAGTTLEELTALTQAARLGGFTKLQMATQGP